MHTHFQSTVSWKSSCPSVHSDKHVMFTHFSCVTTFAKTLHLILSCLTSFLKLKQSYKKHVQNLRFKADGMGEGWGKTVELVRAFTFHHCSLQQTPEPEVHVDQVCQLISSIVQEVSLKSIMFCALQMTTHQILLDTPPLCHLNHNYLRIVSCKALSQKGLVSD